MIVQLAKINLMTLFLAIACASARADASPVRWPAAPDSARVVHEESVALADLDEARGFFGNVANVLFGGSGQKPRLPLDVLASGDGAYVTCQDYPALVWIDLRRGEYRNYSCKALPLLSPIGLARLGEDILVADGGSSAVYRLRGDDLEPWLTRGLSRPTGLAVAPAGDRVYVVDTGAQAVKVFGADGAPLADVVAGDGGDPGWHFPTFAARAAEGVLVNDTLNYRIVSVSADGRVMSQFGREGDGPGAFARPKGMGVDADGNIWVADSLFDNVQIFGADGRLLLVIGGRGTGDGEFWSPTGVSILGDRVLIADTYNNRIQVLRYLEGAP